MKLFFIQAYRPPGAHRRREEGYEEEDDEAVRVAVTLDAEEAVLARHRLSSYREPQQVADGVAQAGEGDEDERPLGIEVVRRGVSPVHKEEGHHGEEGGDEGDGGEDPHEDVGPALLRRVEENVHAAPRDAAVAEPRQSSQLAARALEILARLLIPDLPFLEQLHVPPVGVQEVVILQVHVRR